MVDGRRHGKPKQQPEGLASDMRLCWQLAAAVMQLLHFMTNVGQNENAVIYSLQSHISLSGIATTPTHPHQISGDILNNPLKCLKMPVAALDKSDLTLMIGAAKSIFYEILCSNKIINNSNNNGMKRG